MGTFDRTAAPRWVQISLLAYADTPEGDGAPGPRKLIELSYPEQIAWVQCVLGDLTDYAYKVVTDRELLRPRPAFFTVLIDAQGQGTLAPSDFEWVMASSGGRRVYPEKVVPQNPELLAQLRRHGDVIDADSVRHPDAPCPQVWAHQFVSHLTATIADHLGRLGEGRWFTFDEIALQGDIRVIVRYIWHLNRGDRALGLDIKLEGLREQRLRDLDDPRAKTAGQAIGGLPFGQPVFHSFREVGGVAWIDIGGSREPAG